MAKILIADDNSNVQKTVALALVDLGVEVVSVNNGEAAVRKLATFSPDLILADIFMPVRSGYEVCEYVKKDSRFNGVPVVLLVGAFDPLDEREAQRVGADGILKKPFVPPEPLITMVKTLLERTMSGRLVPAVAAKSAPAQAAASAEFLTSDASGTVQEASEESTSPEFPSSAKRVSFGEGDHPVAFGTLLEIPPVEVAVHQPAPIQPSAIEPVDDEQVLTSPRDANLGDPVFWQNDAQEPEVAPEESPVETQAEVGNPVEVSWSHQVTSAAENEEPLLEPVEPFELVHEGVPDSSLRVADPDSILLDQAAQALLTVESERAEDLVANPMEWIAAADEYAGEATKVAKGKVEPVTDPNEAIEPLHSFEPAASDLPLLSPSSEIPASTELIAAQPALEVEQPAAPVAASAAPLASPEPPVPAAQKIDTAPSPEAQSPEDTARSIPVEKWFELEASIPSVAGEPVAPKLESSTVVQVPIAAVETAPASPAISSPTLAPDPALVEAVVQRVLDKMRPQVVDIITKEFLRPIVQALVHREIEKH